MKILHLNAGSLDGGAAIGALSLHRALLKKGVDSHIVFNGSSALDESEVTNLAGSKLRRLFERMKNTVQRKLFRLRHGHSGRAIDFEPGTNSLNFMSTKTFQNADIIHLHWVNGLVSVDDIVDMKKPVVWTVRDLWPITGGCHVGIANGCFRYRQGCGKCPELLSDDINDVSRTLFQKKREYFKRVNFVVQAPWMKNEIETMKNYDDFQRITVIHNSVIEQTEDVIRTVPNRVDRNITKFLFVAQYIWDEHKGLNILLNALKQCNVQKFELHIIGGGGKAQHFDDLPYNVILHGRVKSVNMKYAIYQECDVVTVPSLFDTFNKTIIEGYQCGLPVVSFNKYGPGDLVEHLETGFKATSETSESLADAINYFIELDSDRMVGYRERCLSASRSFKSERQADAYIKLYNEILKNEKTVY